MVRIVKKVTREDSRRKPALKDDQRGAVMVEFIIAFLPIFFCFWCILQSAGLYSAKLVVKHSAYLGARAAGVVLPDDPANYNKAGMYEVTGERKDDIEKAVMLGLVANGSLMTPAAQIKIGDKQGNAKQSFARWQVATVDVEVPYRCGLPVAQYVVCGFSGFRMLKAKASFAIHGADYTYP